MDELKLEDIPDISERYNCMWGFNFHPHHIDEGYWPTFEEFEILKFDIVMSEERISNSIKLIGFDNTWKITMRWGGLDLYNWFNKNFLKYCENYKLPITIELLEKAYSDFEKEIALPWLNSEESKTITKEELREIFSRR